MSIFFLEMYAEIWYDSKLDDSNERIRQWKSVPECRNGAQAFQWDRRPYAFGASARKK